MYQIIHLIKIPDVSLFSNILWKFIVNITILSLCQAFDANDWIFPSINRKLLYIIYTFGYIYYFIIFYRFSLDFLLFRSLSI